MRYIRNYAILAMAVTAVGCAPLFARTGSCGPWDETSQGLFDYIRLLATDSSAAGTADRTPFQLPLTTDSAVTLVQNSALCATAAAAYDREIQGSNPDRQVDVIRVDSMYVVQDRTEVIGEFVTIFVFSDSTFATRIAAVSH